MPIIPVTPPESNACKTATPRPSGPSATTNYAGTALNVTVKAGSLPVIGSSVQLYAAGNSGNLSTATALGAALVTDANGSVSIPATFTCPYNLSTIYVVATGGKPGSTGAANTNIKLLSVLGTCASLTSGASFVVNEATTVAGAYAMSQFLSTTGSIGASATNFSGLSLAAATAANLVNPTTGAIGGANFPATGTAPSALIASLSNALNACIVSSASPACAQLTAAAGITNNHVATTLAQMVGIASHPALNPTSAFSASQASSVYSGGLTAAPTDLTLYVIYSGGGMNGPSGIGIDSAGNVRVANYFNVASFFSNTGVPTFPGGIVGNNLNNSYGLAMDYRDNTWIPNEQSTGAINGRLGSVTILDSSGNQVTTLGAGGLNYPVAISMTTDGTAWIVDYGNSHLTLTDNSGTPLSGASGYTTTEFAFPVAVAVDSKCVGFVANQSGNTITRVIPDGSAFTSFTTGSGASGVAVDASDNVWTANYYGNSVGLLSSTGKVISSGFTGGGVYHPQGIAVDGSGNVWVANYRAPGLTELAGAAATVPGAPLSPANGYGVDAQMVEAFAIAIDASGNIWITSFGNNTVTEFVGLAAPVRTPLLGPVSTP